MAALLAVTVLVATPQSAFASAPAVSLFPTSVAFGNQPVGLLSQARTVQIANTGDAPLTVFFAGLSGDNPADYVVSSNTCGAPVPAGTSCSVAVAFRPTTTGSRSASLVINDNAAGSPRAVPLSGTGTAPAVQLDRTSLAFGDQALGTTSSPLAVTVTNSGNASLIIVSIGISGANSSDFVISGSSCGSSVAAGSSCSVSVAFRPGASGVRGGNLVLSNNAPGSPHAVPLAGTGIGPGVALSPSAINFGPVTVGVTSDTQGVTVTNTGDSPLIISSVGVAGANAGDFAISGDACTASAGGGTCSFGVAFSPTAAGSRSAAMVFTDNAANSPQTLPLSGSGTNPPAPAVAVAPASLTFGSQTVGTTSGPQTVTVTNTGNAPLSIFTVGLAGASPGDFLLSSNTCGPTVAAGADCAIAVAFKPVAAGSHSATLVVVDDAADSPQAVPLSGTGTNPPGPAVTLSPTSLAFGDQTVGTSSSLAVTLTNTGDATLSISSVGFSGAHPGDFLMSGNSCMNSVAAGARCIITVAFRPIATGVRSAALLVSDNAANSPQSVPLSGNGTNPPAPAVSLSPASLAFGDQTVGTTSGPKTATVNNTGTGPLTISSAGFAGASPGDYVVSNNTCGSAVSAGASCTISVAFKPATTGTRNATLVIVSNAANSPHSLTLTGNGTTPPAPAVALAPTSLSFGDQATGTTSAPQTFTVTNTGNAPLTISSGNLGGANPGDYVLSNSTCGSVVAAGASCDLSVAFRPTATGARSAAVEIADNAPGSPHVLPLSGTGVAPPPPQADLGVSVGATPNPVRTGTTLTYTITVSNFGPSTATGVVLTAQLPADSKFVSYKTPRGSCTAPAPGATGTLTCQLGSLPLGSTSTDIVVKVVAPGGTSITNTATVTSTSADPNPSNNTATVKTAVFGRK